MKSSVQFSSNKYLENISRMFKKLYNDDQLTDVTLCCKEGSIKAHKLILATCSPYFHRIFTENNRDHPIVILHGVSYQCLHDLIELIYKGNVDVVPEALNPLYELAGEFQLSGITGVLRNEQEDKSTGLSPQTPFSNFPSDSGNTARETRYKGQKRVAVDYKDNDGPPSKRTDSMKTGAMSEPNEKASSHGCSDTESAQVRSDVEVKGEEEAPKLSAWAKKQRKFKCELCPSSFKRSSHLSRHQLVHTGERPFACEHCDKAFSRHDKLKHHVRKTHEYGMQDFCVDIGAEIDDGSDSPPPFIISHVRTEALEDSNCSNPPKRPRGRPRKYPIVEKPAPKRGRGRPRLVPLREEGNGENYDITNLPYGDLEYLTMPLQESVMIEPLVEIKTEKEDVEKNAEEEPTEAMNGNKDEEPNPASLKLLENKIAIIGECTISVANH